MDGRIALELSYPAFKSPLLLEVVVLEQVVLPSPSLKVWGSGIV